ncbi:MAG TPA: cytochrome c biogenesis protein CcsA [Holophaga sp.]|nr:cytochrome c biogenesis protein CcsA [Holophaga sp.]
MNLNRLAKWLPAVLALAAAVFAMLPPRPVRGMEVEKFCRMPVLEGGRVKPLDSVARNALLVLRSKQSVRFEGRTIGADEWLLDVMFRPAVADQQPVFLIDDPDVLGLLGKAQESGRYYSFATISPNLQEVARQAQVASQVEPIKRTRFQAAVLHLYDRLERYHRLRNSIQLMETPGLYMELGNLQGPESAQRHQALHEMALFRPLPPLPGQNPDAWLSVGQGLDQAAAGSVHPALTPLARASAAYVLGDAGSFNAAVADLSHQVNSARPDALSKASSEHLFNRVEPFFLGMVFYLLALGGIFFSWLGRREFFQEGAFSFLWGAAIIHTLGLVSRVVLQGRPPVTNLYSSAVFVGWGAVVLGIILERMYRRGFATAVSAAAGFASLIIAHHLAMEGDTMEMMVAVLDSNFWLATHVVTITIGYSATFLAGAIAIAYTLRKLFGRQQDPATNRMLVDMTYGIICFALFFSFVGTVLGGIWADQSWGRFWGWDPKENGALLIVLWNAIILHSRWAGYAREKGIMAMAIFGNVITSLSWFGVNMLGVGLHSYGFTNSAFFWLFAFIGSQLVLIGLTMLPETFSLRSTKA